MTQFIQRIIPRKLNPLANRMYGTVEPYAFQAPGSVGPLRYYTRLINQISPEHVSISWVELMLYIEPRDDYTAFRLKADQVVGWIADYDKRPAEERSEVLKYELNQLLTLLYTTIATGIPSRGVESK